MVYAGTLVVRGSGTAMVAACGPGTELGRIGRMMAAVDPVRTPLLRKMDRFTRRVTTFVLGIGATVVLIDFVFRDRSADEAVLRGIAIAVAAIPEGLPAVLTVTLAIGVRHMAARRAIIRHMPAVEALGSVTTICSDKTGTMTRDEMVVQAVATSDATFDVTGAGYSPSGRVLRAGREIDGIGHGVLSLLGEAAGLCVDASLRHVDGQWTISGDPMEAALIAFSAKAGHAPEALRARMPRIDEIPFDARYRYMATLHRAADGRAILYVKGAPERIIEMCARQRGEAGDLPIQPAYWQTAIHAMAAQGRRILALATRDMGDARAVDAAQAESGLTMLGLVGLADPARPEAIAAVLECRRAGIVVKMITGDHPETARSIARHLGIARHEEVATGAHLDLLPDRALSKLVRTTDVFARTTPEHKLRLVRALQANGEIVAMTGDGANDAPALKRADVGIAMGRKGTDVAREAASIVLADDNFASIVAAVREGRTVYDNIRKAIAWTLPTHGGQGLFVAIAIGLGITLPVTPAQILWVNTATSATLGLTLAFENAEDDVMSRPPRAPDAPLLGGQVAWRVILVSAFFTLAAFSMYEWALQRGLDIAQAQTIVVNTVVVLDIFYLFSVRFLAGTSFTWAGARGTPAVLSGVGVTILLQLALTYLPALQALFHTRALAVRDGLAVIAVGVVFFLVLEGEKWVRLRLAGASAMGRIGRRSAP
jgi:magnesium-transporting ATPase (P-type)